MQHCSACKYSYFHENFRALYDKSFINSRTTSKNSILRSDWISLSLAKSSDVKNMLYNNWVQHKSRSNWNKYIGYKRVFETIKNKKVRKKIRKLIGKKIWKLINGLLGRKRSNRSLAFPNSDAAHNFNSYFINIASDLISKIYMVMTYKRIWNTTTRNIYPNIRQTNCVTSVFLVIKLLALLPG